MASLMSINVGAFNSGGTLNKILFTIDDYTRTYDLGMQMVIGTRRYGQFQTSTQFLVGDPEYQALILTAAINVDYKNIGGTDNLSATLSGSTVTITIQKGQFSNQSVAGTRFAMLITQPVNEPVPPPLAAGNLAIGVTGDCDNVDYTASIANALGDYRIVADGIILVNPWDGAATSISLERGKPVNVKYSSLPIPTVAIQIFEQTVLVPRKLVFTDVLITQENNSTGTNITATVTAIENLTHEYSLDGITYQPSGNFTGQIPGNHTLNVRDNFGCVLDIPFIIEDLDSGGETPTVENDFNFFSISNYNTIPFVEDRGFTLNRYKNPYNSLSCEELGSISHSVICYAYRDKDIRQQFKSSYPYHNIQLFNLDDGTQVNQGFTEIQKNIGAKEKSDVQLRVIDSTTVGVWFNGGNIYIPDTLTVEDVSPYNKILPKWADTTGQEIFIQNLGTFTIEKTGYFKDISASYAQITLSISADASTQAQGVYNKWKYNLFEFITKLPSTGNNFRMVIDYGYQFDQIVGRHVSELIKVKEFEPNDIFIEWSDVQNKGDMVFTSGIGCFAIFPKTQSVLLDDVVSTSELVEGDSRDYSLDQDSRPIYELEIERLNGSYKRKLSNAAATSGFKVNGLGFVKENLESERYGRTNIGSLVMTLRQGENQTAIKEFESVIDISTGKPTDGGSGEAIVLPTLNYISRERLVVGGDFVSPLGGFIAVDI